MNVKVKVYNGVKYEATSEKVAEVKYNNIRGYEVEVGGFVTCFRKRKLIVYASDEAEAEEKAIDKFVELQQKAGNDCDDGTVNYITEL